MFLRADGACWDKSQQVRPLEIASDIAKISPPLSFHVLRHTHGSHLAMQGVPFGVIARRGLAASVWRGSRWRARIFPASVMTAVADGAARIPDRLAALVSRRWTERGSMS